MQIILRSESQWAEYNTILSSGSVSVTMNDQIVSYLQYRKVLFTIFERTSPSFFLVSLTFSWKATTEYLDFDSQIISAFACNSITNEKFVSIRQNQLKIDRKRSHCLSSTMKKNLFVLKFHVITLIRNGFRPDETNP